MEQILLTVTEAAKRLSLGRATAYQLVQRGELPVVRIGRAVRVPARALDQWVEQHTTGGDEPALGYGSGNR
jgi:excisionase family DNA binding protein